MIVKLLTEHHLEFLSLKERCRGSSESTLVKMSNCWKSHAAAYIRVWGWNTKICLQDHRLPSLGLPSENKWWSCSPLNIAFYTLKKDSQKFLNMLRCDMIIVCTGTIISGQNYLDMGGSRGGDRGSGPPPLVNHKNIGFLSNTGPDPLKITKLPIQHSM